MRNIPGSLLSGLVGALIGSFLMPYFAHYYQVRELKFDTLKRLAGYRFVISETSTAEQTDTFFAALNETVIVFHDSPKVLQSLDTLRMQGQGKMNDNLLSVFKAILENLGMKYETLNDAFFLQPFTLSPAFKQRQKSVEQ